MQKMPDWWSCGNCGWRGKKGSLLFDAVGAAHCPDCCSSEVEIKTEEQILAQYVAKKGMDGCPWCGSKNIDGQLFEVQDTEVSQKITCPDCGKKWWDLYTFSGARR